MYVSEGNQVFYCPPLGFGVFEERQLFLTVHPTTSTATVEQQAKAISELFNEQVR